MNTENTPPGYCQCGCGALAPIASATRRAKGHVKGEPVRFVAGHQARVRALRPIEERFWEKVDVAGPDDCWEWTAARTPEGYGALARDRAIGPIYAHRLSWEIHTGTAPDHHVLHTCDNPPCVNPAHLFRGEHDDNMADMATKGRARGSRGERHRSARLTRGDVLAIRRRYTGEHGEQAALAHEYGVTKMTISHIVNRRTWRWLTEAGAGP